MRKALILLVVFAVVGAAAFADGMATPTFKFAINTYEGFGIGGSLPNNFFEYDYNWVGGGAVRLTTNYTSADGNAGLNARLQMVDNTPSVGNGAFSSYTANFNQLLAWAKFFNGMVSVKVGQLDDYTVSTSLWNCFGNSDGKVGMMVDLTPVTGLDIAVFQPVTENGDVLANFVSPSGAGHTTIGASYTMANVANVRAGVQLTSATEGTVIYAQGSLLAMKGLTAIVEYGMTLNTAATPITVLADLAYAMGPLTVGSFIGANYDGTNLFWGAEPTVSYKVTDNVTANVIVNVYDSPVMTGVQSWMSPIDAGLFGGAASATAAATGIYTGAAGIGFGGGASIVYSASGMSVTLGDYYAAATGGGNAFYVNMDFSL